MLLNSCDSALKRTLPFINNEYTIINCNIFVFLDFLVNICLSFIEGKSEIFQGYETAKML